ncbi:iron export ABC transporter permease subunit FetB [Clostridium sp. D2Q-11]|uniref:Iron export ABC transporter permease subunit FetB n=1 Tax=Anaeromonas frigoriresistens TaxID=2683708 RepID=A0A942UUW6_9FIRM|nr:iron export ABC transporter permease subunit FetB [Anaeromonas frigoriresistens]MBS4537311.1 iron export ABC transporter permease subunit FetB [Anaeromonas frigoriresistens]
MSDIVDIGILQLITAYIFVIILLFIVRLKGINREKEIVIASIRMTLQLVLIGYVLVYIFENPSPLLTLIIIGIMETFAIFNIFKRVRRNISTKLKGMIAIAMVVGTFTSILYFLFVVVRIQPWYKPQYFIPLAGMLIGNSMTGISLGVDRLIDGFHSRKEEVETALMLGASSKKAAKRIVNNAFDSAIMPTINSMMGMGIVFLPGMMTGQILSGTSPLTSIKYQIAIMLGIMGSVSLTVIIFLQLGYKTFFNDREQLDV